MVTTFKTKNIVGAILLPFLVQAREGIKQTVNAEYATRAKRKSHAQQMRVSLQDRGGERVHTPTTYTPSSGGEEKRKHTVFVEEKPKLISIIFTAAFLI